MRWGWGCSQEEGLKMACGAGKIPEMALTAASKDRALEDTNIGQMLERGAREGESLES